MRDKTSIGVVIGLGAILAAQQGEKSQGIRMKSRFAHAIMITWHEAGKSKPSTAEPVRWAARGFVLLRPVIYDNTC